MNLYKVEFKHDSYMGRATRNMHIISDDITGIENIIRLKYDAPTIVKSELIEESVLIGGHVGADA